jgi:septal ring factor EnvC (AmiA/AmiB activator)
MLTTSCFIAMTLAVGPLALGAPADPKQTLEETSKATVRLKLNAIETAKLLERYQKQLQREADLSGSVRATVKSGDDRLPQYQDALKEAQDDLERIKQKLVDLEMEKAKLLQQLGKKEAAEGGPESVDRTNRLLEQILDRVISIEKRLDKADRQK